MAKHWTKLRSDVVLSERMADLLERNPLAYGLFVNAKAVCDDYGRLPASPRKFKGLASPLTGHSLLKVEKALADMEACGVIRIYGVNGDSYLEIIYYNEVEETEWRNVGKPEYPAPEGWQPPQSLLDFLTKYADQAGVFPARYGLGASEAQARRGRNAGAEQARRDDPAESEVESEVESESKAKENDVPRPGWQVPDDFQALTGNYPEIGVILRAHYGHWKQTQRERWWYGAAQSLESRAAQDAGLTEEALVRRMGEKPPANSSRGDWYTDKEIERLQRGRDGPAQKPQRLQGPMSSDAFGEARP